MSVSACALGLCHVFLIIMVTPQFFFYMNYPAFQERKGTGMRVMCVSLCARAHVCMYVVMKYCLLKCAHCL